MECDFFMHWTFKAWRWEHYTVSKRRVPVTQWGDDISQKNGIKGVEFLLRGQI
jgi:hypothetical protein